MPQQPAGRSQETKDRVLDAAERLFAEHGFDGTSLRAITAEAGVNLAAANYHFGTKEALLEAVLRRRLDPINRGRIRRLEALEADRAGPPSLERILAAFFEPAFGEIRRLGAGGEKFVQLAGRTHSETKPAIRRIFLRMFEEVVARYLPALERALPGIARSELHWKFHFLVGAMAHTLTWGRHDDCQSLIGERALEPDAALGALLAFCAAGLRAEVPAHAEHRR